MFSASLILATGISIGTVDLPGIDSLANAIAGISALTLGYFGVPLTLDGAVINADGFLAIVAAECTGIELILLFSTAVLVWPVALRSKAIALLVFIPLLAILNLVRVITLLLTGIGIPDHFDFVHFRIWQPALALIAVAIWLLWLRWASAEERTAHFSAHR